MKRSDVTEVLSRPGRDVGTVVAGRYRLAAHIGSGGTADVWRAYDESRDRPVTLKILRDPKDADARRHFLAEARRLETLDHPSIVPVLGIHEALGDTLIAFEQVEGEPLDQLAGSRPALAPRKIALLLIQIADAVEAFHSHGFVHLDLKPANVLMGSDGRPRLLDFGIAEPIGHAPEVPRGTPGFASPEVTAGRAASRASDVYGLAAIAKELLGAHPTPRVASVLRRGLEPDPTRRYGRPRTFVYGVALAVLIDEELAALDRATRRARAAVAALTSRGAGRRVVAFAKARPELSFRVAAASLIVAGLLLQQAHPTTEAANAGTMPALVRPAFDVPPLGAYGATFESQAPYPNASANSTVEWTVALRNTGSAGWYRGVDGAQASLILDDGTVVAVQSTQYVGPGQIGWFTARFRAPSQPGPHTIRLRPAINGRGPLPDLGIHAVVTVSR
ncbi:MAG TPA: protein kinase [Candidatus Limnocylindria bacterium]|nr:protein kinase [Candidatus Limnocylindria bacterium]